MERHRTLLLIAITIIALGVVFRTALREHTSSLGIVLIAVGGVMLIAAFSSRRKITGNNKDKG